MAAPSIPELLAPAGDMERLKTALAYGADSVYLGGSSLNLRAKAKGFSQPELEQAFVLAAERGRRCYYCLNAFPRERHMAETREQLAWLVSLKRKPDALIIADPGVLRLARRALPDMDIHLSTQANTANTEALKFWRDLGVRRANLARELSAPEIKALARADTGLELEAFVHGAQCMALSGRCLMSSYLRDRPANMGLCTHPCRYGYRAGTMLFEERTRPGAPLWETVEGDDFSAVYSAEDLCLILHMAWFARHHIHAVKIEGRTKTASYLAQVVAAYRSALDALSPDAEQVPDRAVLLAELVNTATRPLSTGFFHGRKRGESVILAQPPSDEARVPILARIGKELGPGRWLAHVRGPWDATAPFRILLPGLDHPQILPQDYRLEDDQGTRLDRAHSGTDRILLCGHPQLATDLFLRADHSW